MSKPTQTRRPLRRKMILVILVASAVGLLLVSAGWLVSDATTYRERAVRDLRAKGTLLAGIVAVAVSFDDPESAESSLQWLEGSPEVSLAVVFGPERRRLASYPATVLASELPEAPPPAEVSFQADSLDLLVPLDPRNPAAGALLLRRTLPPLPQRLPQFALVAGAVLVALLSAAIVLLIGLQKVITDPILALADAARTVRDRQDYSVRVARLEDDEIGDLTETFHQMLGTIQERQEALRQALDEVEEGRLELHRELEERRRVEAALRESQRFNQQIADSIPSLLYVQDIQERRNTYVNRQVEPILGFEQSQVVGDAPALLEIPHPDDSKVVEARLARLAAAQDGEIVETEYRMRRSDGSHRWLFSRDTVFERGPDGRPRLVLGVAQDVTEQKALQERLIQAQKMESIGRLAGGVAHDFNNLLTVIVGSIDMIELDLGERHAALTYLRNAQQATSQAADLTQQLLAFARRQVIEPRVIDLNGLVLDAEKMLRSLVGDSVELAVVTRRDLPTIKADPAQMLQVLMNLAVNARDAMTNGGTLTVETRLDTVAADSHRGIPAGRYVSMRVTDTGVGMDAHTQQRLFEPFFTTKPTGKGTGLGLATCYGIVEQSGGFMYFESELGRGSSFHVLLPPAAEAGSARPERQRHQALPSGEETVLVVEDNPLVRATAVAMLRARGYTVLEAASGPDALRLVAGYRGTLDLVVTDVVMPQMSGPEVAERLIEMRPALRILYVSGYTAEALVPPGSAGVAFLQKPYTSERLIRKVREVLDA